MLDSATYTKGLMVTAKVEVRWDAVTLWVAGMEEEATEIQAEREQWLVRVKEPEPGEMDSS